MFIFYINIKSDPSLCWYMMVYDWLPSERFKCQSLEVGKDGIKECFGEKVEFERSEGWVRFR